jgi:hypothetical protein
VPEGECCSRVAATETTRLCGSQAMLAQRELSATTTSWNRGGKNAHVNLHPASEVINFDLVKLLFKPASSPRGETHGPNLTIRTASVATSRVELAQGHGWKIGWTTSPSAQVPALVSCPPAAPMLSSANQRCFQRPWPTPSFPPAGQWFATPDGWEGSPALTPRAVISCPPYIRTHPRVLLHFLSSSSPTLNTSSDQS